jgi:uncharacterized repeat protein (TIGR01451 family)
MGTADAFDVDAVCGEACLVAQEPGIAVDKEADVDDAKEGDTITYTYTVTNPGDMPLSNVTVTDNLVSGVIYLSGDDGDGILQTNETWVFTGSYQVPWFTAGPVENTGNATGEFDGTEVWDTDDESVAILHNPGIAVDKTGPANIGYFAQLEANYTYSVNNTGDCSLDVVLTDDQIAVLTGPTGDDNGNGYLDPGETWYYASNQLIECTGIEELFFTNVATAEGTDVTGAVVSDEDDWTVTIFQWQPRTIGYWGNWDNHWSANCTTDLVNRVNTDSAYFEGLTSADVNSILLAVQQTGKMTLEKARLLTQKQLLAAWLNVESYIGATDGNATTCGSLDAGMRPGATVYLSKVDGAEALFGAATLTVQEVLDAVDAGMGTWDKDQLLIAKDVLDEMNNAESNGYKMFMAP